MQIAFVAPSGGLAVAGAQDMVAEVHARVAAAVEQGWPVFYTRTSNPPSSPTATGSASWTCARGSTCAALSW